MSQEEQTPIVDENHIIAERREKLAQLRKNGVAFPNDFVPTHHAADLHEHYGEISKEHLAEKNITVKVAGRMMLKRVMGKASFATVQDRTGQIQFYINDADASADAHNAFKHWDMGDFIAAEGVIFKTNKGELSILVKDLRLLSKSLRPLPDKFHGLSDQEMKYRQRYVDLIVSPETRQTFLARSKAMSSIRHHMQDAGFMEVETPMLHPIPGGAAAKPFITHHNALDMEMYLRIAPELYLKRLVVGGFERVFEVNRNFRNEGVSPRHNPEFTMMEFYAAYTDYKWLMTFTEELIRAAAIDAQGTANLTYQGKPLDLSKPFQRLTIAEAILKYAPLSKNSTPLLNWKIKNLSVKNLKSLAKTSMDQLLKMLALEPFNWLCLKLLLKSIYGNQLTSLTTLLKSAHWPENLTRDQASQSALSYSSLAVRLPMASLS